MEQEFLITEPLYYFKDADNNDTLEMKQPPNIDDLTEVYVVAYKIKSNIPDIEDKEIYTFTTIFNQAYKRFKLIPNGHAVFIRIMTDEDNLIQLAKDGNGKEWKEDEITEEIEEMFKNLKFKDIYGDITKIKKENNV